MSVIAVAEIAERRSQLTLQRFGRVYTRTFQVITDSTLTAMLDVKFAPGIPQLYPFPDYYVGPSGEFDPGALLQSLNAVQVDRDDPYLWHVTAEYATIAADPAFASSQGGSGSSGTQSENPLLRPVRVTFGDVHRAVPFDTPTNKNVKIYKQQAGGVPILITTVVTHSVVNVLGETFDPVPEIDVIDTSIVAVRNEAFFDPVTADSYKNKVNSDDFAGFVPGTVKVMGISATNEFEQAMQYFQITYRFETRKDHWVKRLLNVGRYSLKDTVQPDEPKNRVMAEADAGQATGGLVRLDEQGGKLAKSVPTYYFRYECYEEMPFSIFMLPL